MNIGDEIGRRRKYLEWYKRTHSINEQRFRRERWLKRENARMDKWNAEEDKRVYGE